MADQLPASSSPADTGPISNGTVSAHGSGEGKPNSTEAPPEAYASDSGTHSPHSVLGGSRRKKGVPWTEEEHKQFLTGLGKLGKGDWRGISRHFVTTRTPTQVASHAQKFFIRQQNASKRKRRSSLFDITSDQPKDPPASTPRLSASYSRPGVPLPVPTTGYPSICPPGVLLPGAYGAPPVLPYGQGMHPLAFSMGALPPSAMHAAAVFAAAGGRFPSGAALPPGAPLPFPGHPFFPYSAMPVPGAHPAQAAAAAAAAANLLSCQAQQQQQAAAAMMQAGYSPAAVQHMAAMFPAGSMPLYMQQQLAILSGGSTPAEGPTTASPTASDGTKTQGAFAPWQGPQSAGTGSEQGGGSQRSGSMPHEDDSPSEPATFGNGKLFRPQASHARPVAAMLGLRRDGSEPRPGSSGQSDDSKADSQDRQGARNNGMADGKWGGSHGDSDQTRAGIDPACGPSSVFHPTPVYVAH